MPNPSQPSEVQIVIPGVPRKLVERIEKLADRQQRSRAGQVRVLLEEIVDLKERELKTAAA